LVVTLVCQEDVFLNPGVLTRGVYSPPPFSVSLCTLFLCSDSPSPTYVSRNYPPLPLHHWKFPRTTLACKDSKRWYENNIAVESDLVVPGSHGLVATCSSVRCCQRPEAILVTRSTMAYIPVTCIPTKTLRQTPCKKLL